MDPLEHDPLLDRLRAADPAAGLDDPRPDRPAVRAALGHRTRAHRLRVALPAPVLAAGVTAVVLIPSGAPAAADVVEIVDRAAEATAQPPNAIVTVRSRIEGRFWDEKEGHGGLSEDETAWVRSATDGKPRDIRTISRLVTLDGPRDDGPSASAPRLTVTGDPKEEESTTTYATPGEVRGAVSKRYEVATGRTTVERDSAQVPRLVFDAHRLLENAKRDGDSARLDGEATIGGRRTYRLVVRERIGPDPVPGIEERTELYVDKETYEAVELRTTSKGRTAPAGVRFTYELVQRVVGVDEVPDTAENRKVLELRGPKAFAAAPPAGG